MAFIAKNPLTMPEVKSAPPVPPAGTRGIYAGEDGWYEIDSNGRIKKISGAEGTGDLGRVYKYEMSCTWSLLQHGLIESDVGYPFEAGMVFNIEEDDIIPPEYTESGNAIEVLEGDNIAIASIIDGKPKFDKLSATIDLSNYVTKTELDLKVSSVYRYKGSVDNFNHLPSKPSVGDVYNVKNSYSKTAYGVNVTQVADSGYGSYPEDEYVYLYLSSGLGFDTGKTIEVFDENKISLGEFVVKEKSGNTVSGQVITNSGLYDVCVNIAQNATGSGDIFGMTIDINKMYYFTNVTATSYSIEVPFINAGDNVAWTGNEWDILGGTIDLSNYVTKDEIADIDTGLREATFEEIDTALADMENTYTQMLYKTNQIIEEQNELIGGEG